MKINGKEITQKQFAFDGCHKFYLLEDHEMDEAANLGYIICPIEELEKMYKYACPLRFINAWDLSECYAHQGENAVFEY